MITVEGINKASKIYRHRSGMAGAIKDLFGREYENKKAVKDLSAPQMLYKNLALGVA